MKAHKFLVPALLVTALAGGTFITTSAIAHNSDMHNGHGYNNTQSNLTEEQRTKARALVEKAHEQNEALRNKIFIKDQELQALQNATNPDVQAVSKAASELVSLRQELRTARKQLGTEIDTALGLKPGTHSLGEIMRHGRGMEKGYHKGKGMGRECNRDHDHRFHN